MKHILRNFLLITSFLLSVSIYAEINHSKSLVCPTASISYPNSVICTSSYNPQEVILTGTDAYLGGVFSSSPAGLMINSSTGAIIPTASTPGTYTITYTIPAGSGCGIVTATTTVTVNPTSGTPIGLPTTTICSGDITNLILTDNLSISGTILEWTVVDSQNATGFTISGSGLSPIYIGDLLINNTNSQGYVKYSVTSKLGNCEGGTTIFNVYVNPLPNPVLTDGSVCIDSTTGTTYQSYLLDTQLSNPNFNYEWFLLNTNTNTYDQIAGESAATYETSAAGNYQVIVTNTSTNCFAFATANVIETFPATEISTTISDNSTVTVNVNPIGTGNLIYALNNGAWQESNIFTDVEPGIYMVLVSDLEGCTNLAVEVLINDEEVQDLVMYPNPSSDTLRFKNNNKVRTIQISNQVGQVVLTKEINLKTGTIDLSDLNNGIYNVTLETESGIVNQRIVKQ